MLALQSAAAYAKLPEFAGSAVLLVLLAPRLSDSIPCGT
jgi:hypothetical protein